jgi:hypothetical protein
MKKLDLFIVVYIIVMLSTEWRVWKKNTALQRCYTRGPYIPYVVLACYETSQESSRSWIAKQN